MDFGPMVVSRGAALLCVAHHLTNREMSAHDASEKRAEPGMSEGKRMMRKWMPILDSLPT